MRTADTIAQQNEAVTSHRSNHKETREAKIARVAPYQWKPGQSGNPKGARKSDVARAIAKQIFENNEEEAYKALAKALLKGNAYVFQGTGGAGLWQVERDARVWRTGSDRYTVSRGKEARCSSKTAQRLT